MKISFSTQISLPNTSCSWFIQGVSTETLFLHEALGQKWQEEVPVPPTLCFPPAGAGAALAWPPAAALKRAESLPSVRGLEHRCYLRRQRVLPILQVTDLHKGKGFTQQTARARTVGPRPFGKSIPEVNLHSKLELAFPFLTHSFPPWGCRKRRQRAPGALWLCGAVPPPPPSPSSVYAAAGSGHVRLPPLYLLQPGACGGGGGCCGGCSPRPPLLSWAGSAGRGPPCSAQVPSPPSLHLGAGALQRAAVLPRPARRAQVVFLMATSCRSRLKPNANHKVVREQLCCYFRRLCPLRWHRLLLFLGAYCRRGEGRLSEVLLLPFNK